MKRAALLLLALPLSAVAEDKTTDLQGALAMEWLVAHCVVQKDQSLTVMMASMVINGSDPDLVTAERERIRERLKVFPTVKDACAAFQPPAAVKPEYSVP